jgi:glutamate synthase domain-containing protein 2
MLTTFVVLLLLLVALFLRDVFFNKRHTITRNFPVAGHLRFIFERFRPELRQYFMEGDRDGQPFNRVERSYIYRSAKGENNLAGFGSDADFNALGGFFIRQSAFPKNGPHTDQLACAKVIGPHRRKPYHPGSVINISAMSFGALGYKATTANALATSDVGAFHNTGEGGFSPYHKNANQVVFQIGTGYFGCGITESDGTRRFSMDILLRLVNDNPSIKAIEVKLSQGAKAGKGGVLPAEKVTAEIAAIRGVPQGVDVISPAQHNTFGDVAGMIDFIENIAEATGLPVGIKSAVGHEGFWHELAQRMESTGKGPDFVTIDGGEGGTGAAPVAFSDHVGLPFVDAFTLVYKVFQQHGLVNKTVFIASAKLGFPAKAVMAFAMGADLINIAREAMISAGCIHAKQCHLGTCPSGIATHNWWLQRGFDVADKTDRIARFIKTLRSDINDITHAAGYDHPSEFRMNDIVMNTGDVMMRRSLADMFGYEK